MKRSDREVTRMEDLLALVSQCKVCRLGLWDGAEVYIVPLNFGYEYQEGKLTLYFHSAKEGRKLDILRQYPRAAFEMDGGHHLVEGTVPCQYGYAYFSIMGQGKAALLDDEGEKVHALRRLMLQQTGKDFELTPAMSRSVAVVRLTVEEISGKWRAMPDHSVNSD